MVFEWLIFYPTFLLFSFPFLGVFPDRWSLSGWSFTFCFPFFVIKATPSSSFDWKQQKTVGFRGALLLLLQQHSVYFGISKSSPYILIIFILFWRYMLLFSKCVSQKVVLGIVKRGLAEGVNCVLHSLIDFVGG